MTTFNDDLALVGSIPAEVKRWWKDGHRWDRETEITELHPVELADGSTALAVFAVEDPDHRLWRYLGHVSDALLLVIAVLVILMVAL